MSTAIQIIDLEQLKIGLPGLTPTLGAMCLEACTMCFYWNHHSSGILLDVQGEFQNQFVIEWHTPVTEQMQRSWQDRFEATEYGATGLAILLILALTPYTVVQRSRRGTGFDYWLGPKQQSSTLPFQFAARLEVSSILVATQSNSVQARVRQKQEQIELVNPKSRLHSYTIVVEFGQPMADVRSR
jgi:hypothetical protein